MKENAKAEELVKKWLEENGYDYEVKTYSSGEIASDVGERSRDIISIPAEVENVELFMEQFIQSFKGINGVTELRKQV